MSRVPKDSTAAERARWLAELAGALDNAQKLASRLGLFQMQDAEAVELSLRLAAARAQVEALQVARPDDSFGEIGRIWSSPPLWPGDTIDGR